MNYNSNIKRQKHAGASKVEKSNHNGVKTSRWGNDAKTVKSIAKKIYGNEATLCEGRWFSKCENGKGSTWMYCFLEFAKKDYPNECPDVARMAAFIEACKKALGDDCQQAKATVYYNKGSETYSLIWEQFVYDN